MFFQPLLCLLVISTWTMVCLHNQELVAMVTIIEKYEIPQTNINDQLVFLQHISGDVYERYTNVEMYK